MNGKVAVVPLALCALLTASVAKAEDGGTASGLEGFWTTAYEKAAAILQNSSLFAKYEWKVLAKAQPDECYYGIGDPRNVQSFYSHYPSDLGSAEVEACRLDPQGQPKVNQAYVWGLTKTLGRIWAGTLANTHCLVMSSFYGPDSPFPPSENDAWVCEMGAQTGLGMFPPGDIRPPRIFVYDTIAETYTDLTGVVLTHADPAHRARLLSTIGLRSAGSHNGVVFLGGVGFQGVNIFAFNARTMTFIDSATFPYTNIRQWNVIAGHLYTGVGKPGGGEVLRWTGDVANPFSFEVVGDLIGDPAYLHWHAGRIFVATWGGPPGIGNVILMSPLKGADQMLTAEDADDWQIAWRLSDYEVEPAAVQGGGALKSFDGYLYWGTMCVPGTGLYAFSQIYEGEPLGLDTHLGTYRPITLFRGKNFGEPGEVVELLYGTSHLPKYDPVAHAWTIVPNNMGQTPKYGLAGFGNYFNNYTWWMEVFDDNLFVGTMDHLYLLGAQLGGELQVPDRLRQLATHFYGGDLWRFPRGDKPAIPVSLSGLGNYSSYGIRTMVLGPDRLYLGMANPMNLLTDPADDKPEGGWELIELWRRADTDKDGIPDGDDTCPHYANDEVGDPCCADEDADGVADGLDACPFEFNDLFGDACNHDEDGDGVLDEVDACPFDPAHSSGDPCVHDDDGDGVLDADDACPSDPNDAIGDPCDHDEDGDGVLDEDDPCPFEANDAFGDPCDHDEDGDGVLDEVDTCPLEPNDAFRDPCDHDEDGDGFLDEVDACPDEAGADAGCPVVEEGGGTVKVRTELPEPEVPAGCGCSADAGSGGSPGMLLGALLALWMLLAVRPRRYR